MHWAAAALLEAEMEGLHKQKRTPGKQGASPQAVKHQNTSWFELCYIRQVTRQGRCF